VYGYDDFNENQLDVLEQFVLNRKCGLLVAHTGAGKSLLFQLPLFLDDKYNSGKVTIVVVPTVSLMFDHLREIEAIKMVLALFNLYNLCSDHVSVVFIVCECVFLLFVW